MVAWISELEQFFAGKPFWTTLATPVPNVVALKTPSGVGLQVTLPGTAFVLFSVDQLEALRALLRDHEQELATALESIAGAPLDETATPTSPAPRQAAPNARDPAPTKSPAVSPAPSAFSVPEPEFVSLESLDSVNRPHEPTGSDPPKPAALDLDKRSPVHLILDTKPGDGWNWSQNQQAAYLIARVKHDHAHDQRLTRDVMRRLFECMEGANKDALKAREVEYCVAILKQRGFHLVPVTPPDASAGSPAAWYVENLAQFAVEDLL